MTRKHFRLLAEAFRRRRQAIDEAGHAVDVQQRLHEVVDDLEDEVCVVLNDANPGFAYQKFTDASGRKE